jgi:hypothetical protein
MSRTEIHIALRCRPHQIQRRAPGLPFSNHRSLPVHPPPFPYPYPYPGSTSRIACLPRRPRRRRRRPCCLRSGSGALCYKFSQVRGRSIVITV